jgi:uncharacterized protein (DUF924 family)
MTDDEQIRAVIDFWQRTGDRGLWFGKDAGFDEEFRGRFLALHMAAAARELDGWLDSAGGALALMVLLDQFPRNAFRGTGHMYATDPLARSIARRAHAAGWFGQAPGGMDVFLALPFSHSEDIADQEFAVELNLRLGEPWLPHALQHRDIIRRFGRFPHRNPLLGRESTAAELAWLAEGGFGG